jgi:hypothetical protein
MWMKQDLTIVKTIPMVIVLEGKDVLALKCGKKKRKSQLD